MNAEEELRKAMSMLALQPNCLFVGQSVRYPGTAMYESIKHVPEEQRLCFPVAEDLQLGFCTGLALQGFLPVCIFPRMDFMLRAMDQLVNHLDKMKLMSRRQFDPKVIIRTRVGSRSPLDAGPQHTQNYSRAFREMSLLNIEVFTIDRPELMAATYAEVCQTPHSVVVVEAF